VAAVIDIVPSHGAEPFGGGLNHMDMNRRQFFRVSSAGLVGSSLVALGFSPTAALAETRNFKLARTTETRSTCPYCSVSCGMIIYTLGDKAKNVKSTIVHVEGDPDHPVNRGTLCPKGAGVMDMIQSPNRVKYPAVREPGSNEWKRISWDEALTRIARHMKADRDANLIKTNAAGTTVNRWNSTGLLVSSASSNESGHLTVKVARGLGMVALDTQARI
jgi:formate dehydrogenase major subunit